MVQKAVTDGLQAWCDRSAADAQFGDNVRVALLALVAHVAEQPLATTDHLQQSLAGREIMNVVLEMAAETVDCSLSMVTCPPRASVGSGLVGVDQLLLLGGIERHARGVTLTMQESTLPGHGTGSDISWMQALSQASLSAWSRGVPLSLSCCRAACISWFS